MVANINLGCYYVFGLPLGFIFGYVIHWGVEVKKIIMMMMKKIISMSFSLPVLA